MLDDRLALVVAEFVRCPGVGDVRQRPAHDNGIASAHGLGVFLGARLDDVRVRAWERQPFTSLGGTSPSGSGSAAESGRR